MAGSSSDVWQVFCVVGFCFILRASAYNLDIEFPIIFRNTPDSYFGYSVALLRNREGAQALITAPRANSSILGDQLYQPGVLNSCKISFASRSLQQCTEVALDKLGNTYVYGREAESSYHDKKDNMFLGVSLDVQQNTPDGRVVTCGHLWKNQYYVGHYLANGVCYVINNDLDPRSVKKLVPLVKKSKQSLIPPGIYYYAFGQAGTSAAFSEDGKYLLLGAPGFYDWTGTVLSYLNPTSDGENYKTPVIPNPPADQNLSPESYIGYSVTSGRFFDTPETFIATGAPRDRNSYGQVYIIKALRSSSDKFVVHMKKEGTQFGEYFGASLMGVDVTNDGFTDLFVGAPYFSAESGGDEGKVYVYISNGMGLQSYAEIVGENKPNAQFGACISNIGDVNQDGYNDIAVGAPYEEVKGAIYIYHGGHSGLNTQYVQRIAASDVSPSLSGFGISISRGLDMDSNYYPDILVGAYASSEAVLFRSHPIIHMSPKLEFHPQQINTNITLCDLDGVKVPCINVTTCLQYTGKHAVLNFDFETELYMDFGRLNSAALSRGYFLESGKSVSVIRRKLSLEIGKDACFTDGAYLRPDAKDIITPIEFLFSYNLANNSSKDQFCKTCPYLNPGSATNITKSVSFLTGCDKDNRCLADLVVKARIVGNPTNAPLIIGKNTTLTLEIDVTNVGEPAYLAELFISLPPETPNINQDFCTLLTEQQKEETNASLQCELGNPLQKDKTVRVQIKIDVSRLPLNKNVVNVVLRARTASDETNPPDNDLDVPIFFKVVADASITGTADHDQIPYDDAEDKPVSITHTYFVMNHGPSPIEVIDIVLFVPTSLQRENGPVEFLSFTSLEADSGKPLTIPAKCNDSTIELKPIKQEIKKTKGEVFGEGDLVAQKGNNRTLRRVPPETSLVTESPEVHASDQTKKRTNENAVAHKRKNFVINCNTANCMAIHCKASPFFDSRKFARISVSLQLNAAVLSEHFDPWYRIEFVTAGKIFIQSAKSDIQPEQNDPDETSVKSILVRPGPPPSEEVEKWIIFVSIGIGILLLVIILIALIKIGFFKRQQKEKMRQMMRQADLKEWEPYLIADEADGGDGDAFKSEADGEVLRNS